MSLPACAVVAGIDVGNSTTEIVLAHVDQSGYLATQRCPTRGQKGSRAALENAARLLAAMETRVGVRADVVLLADQHPVTTTGLPLIIPERPGPVSVVAIGAGSPAGTGWAVGHALHLDAALPPSPPANPPVVLVSRSWDFEDAAAAINGLAAVAPVAAVLVEADEARLIGNRLNTPVPIVDEVDVAAIRPGELLAVEVAAPGTTLRKLHDPLWLGHWLHLEASQVAELAPISRRLADARAAVVSVRSISTETGTGTVTFRAQMMDARCGDTGQQIVLPDQIVDLAGLRPGSVTDLTWSGPPAQLPITAHATDLFAPDLHGLGAGAWLREGQLNLDHVPLAVLSEGGRTEPLASAATDVFQRPAYVLASETSAAEAGASTTPAAPTDACVCDFGGGTVDVMWRAHRVTAAGAGQLLTETVAALVGIGSSLAEVAKRTASVFIESPHLCRSETGEKIFLNRVLDARTVGQLAVFDGDTPRAITAKLAVEEWRSIRLGLKRLILGVNLARCLAALPDTPSTLLLAGGAADDHELAATVASRLPGTVVASADVAGRYGVRYAVAVGLVEIARGRTADSAPIIA